MGTEKRARQKANRQARLAELEREETRSKWKRRILLWGTLAVVFVGGAFLLSYLIGGNDDNAADSADTTVAEEVAFEYGTGECPPTDGSAEQTRTFDDAPQQCIDPAKTYTAEVTTNKGSFTIALDPENAPGTVNNFVTLARFKFYDGLTFHRIVPDFVIQGGDPNGDGSGGPGYEIADELPSDGYQEGSVAMANAGPGTSGSQFFVVTGPNGAELPPNYSKFGSVTEGQDVVDAIAQLGGPDEQPTETITIESVTITES